MQITARAWCAVRAMVAAAQFHAIGPVRATSLAESQEVALKYLYSVMTDLRCAGLINTFRGTGGGFRLARSPDEISVGDVLRAVDGSLTGTVGQRPQDWHQDGSAVAVGQVWQVLHDTVSEILDNTTIAAIAASADGSRPRAGSRSVTR